MDDPKTLGDLCRKVEAARAKVLANHATTDITYGGDDDDWNAFVDSEEELRSAIRRCRLWHIRLGEIMYSAREANLKSFTCSDADAIAYVPNPRIIPH